MEIDLNLIEESCGKQPENQEFFIVGNDPNFVFTSDPGFEVIALYDTEGNIINVNSWLECVHYLKGGWTSNQIVSSINEQYLLISLLSIAAVSTLLIIYLKKRKNKFF